MKVIIISFINHVIEGKSRKALRTQDLIKRVVFIFLHHWVDRTISPRGYHQLSSQCFGTDMI